MTGNQTEPHPVLRKFERLHLYNLVVEHLGSSACRWNTAAYVTQKHSGCLHCSVRYAQACDRSCTLQQQWESQ